MSGAEEANIGLPGWSGAGSADEMFLGVGSAPALEGVDDVEPQAWTITDPDTGQRKSDFFQFFPITATNEQVLGTDGGDGHLLLDDSSAQPTVRRKPVAETEPETRVLKPVVSPGPDGVATAASVPDGQPTRYLTPQGELSDPNDDQTVKVEPVAPPARPQDLVTVVLEPVAKPYGADAGALSDGHDGLTLAAQGFQLIGDRHDQLGPDSFSPGAQPVDMFAPQVPPRVW